MVEILAKYRDAKNQPWIETIHEGQPVIINNKKEMISLVGTLSAQTTPADFDQFAKLAALFTSREKMRRRNGYWLYRNRL